MAGDKSGGWLEHGLGCMVFAFFLVVGVIAIWLI